MNDATDRAVEISLQEFTSDCEYTMSSLQSWLEGNHRVMLLSGGIGGIVVPLLSSQAPASVQTSGMLREGTVWLFACVAIGVAMQFVGRYLMAAFMGRWHVTQLKRCPILAAMSSASSSEVTGGPR